MLNRQKVILEMLRYAGWPGKPVVRKKAEHEGFRRERREKEGGGNEARRRQKGVESLLIGTRATDVGGRENQEHWPVCRKKWREAEKLRLRDFRR